MIDRAGDASPLFFPSLPDKTTATAAVLDLVRRPPRQFGVERTRWTLATIRRVCPWLATHSLSGVWRVLTKLGIVGKRGRAHLHSPDPAYDAKRAAIAACLAAARVRDGPRVVLYQDEITLHRQPTLAPAWAARGRAQPLAAFSPRADTPVRVVATLDAADGRVVFRRRRDLAIPALVGFYRAVVAAYPDADQIDIILDNWPVHFHPDLLVALVPQQCPFPFVRPGNWPTAPSPEAVRKWGDLQLPIQLVPLPTYAPWLNPIEKLWRWLRQDVVHLHPWADDLPALGGAADAFLDRFASATVAAADLLRFVGLKPSD